MADTTIGSLGYDITANAAGLQKTLKGVEAQAASSAKNVSTSFGSAFSSLKNIVIGGAIAGVVKKLIEARIEVETTQRQFKVAFGNMAKSEERWAKAHSNSMAMATDDIQKIQSKFKVFFDQQGIAAKAGAGYSETFTKLAADIAAFKNMNVEDVASKLFKAMATGRTKGLVELGITGIGTAAQTTAGRLQVMAQILQKAQYMQGAAGQDNTRQTIEKLKVSIQELTEAAAAGLVPILKAVVPPITAMVNGLVAADEATHGWTTKIIALTLAGFGIIKVINTIRRELTLLREIKLVNSFGSLLGGLGSRLAGGAANAVGQAAATVGTQAAAGAVGSATGSAVGNALGGATGGASAVGAYGVARSKLANTAIPAAYKFVSMGGRISPSAAAAIGAVAGGVTGLVVGYGSVRGGLHAPLAHEDLNTVLGSEGAGALAGPIGAVGGLAVGGLGVAAKYSYLKIANKMLKGQEAAANRNIIGSGKAAGKTFGDANKGYGKDSYGAQLAAEFGAEVNSLSAAKRYLLTLSKEERAGAQAKIDSILANYKTQKIGKGSLKAYQIAMGLPDGAERDALEKELDKVAAGRRENVLANYSNLMLGAGNKDYTTDISKKREQLGLEGRAAVYTLKSTTAQEQYHTTFGTLTDKEQQSLIASKDYQEKEALIRDEYAKKNIALDIEAAKIKRSLEVDNANALVNILASKARLTHSTYAAEINDIQEKYNTEKAALVELEHQGIKTKNLLAALDKRTEVDRKTAWENELDRIHQLTEAITGRNISSAAGIRSAVMDLATKTLLPEAGARREMGILGMGVHSPFSVQSAQAKESALQKTIGLEKEALGLDEEKQKLLQDRAKTQRELDYRKQRGDLKPGEAEAMNYEIGSYGTRISGIDKQRAGFGSRYGLIGAQYNREMENIARNKAETQNESINSMLPRLSYLQGLSKYGDTTVGREKSDRDERLKQLELDKSTKIKSLQNLELSTSDKQAMLNAIDADFARKGYDIKHEQQLKLQQRVGFVDTNQVWQGAMVEGIKTGFAAPNVDRKLQEDQLSTLKNIEGILNGTKTINIDQLNKLDNVGMAA